MRLGSLRKAKKCRFNSFQRKASAVGFEAGRSSLSEALTAGEGEPLEK